MSKYALVVISFLLVTGLTVKGKEKLLIGGRPAEVKDWPASVYASSGGGRCSATVVGSRAVFIAAHCVEDGKSITFFAGPNRYTARCTHAQGYKKNQTADWALCLTDKEVSGIEYEVVNTDAGQVKVGDEILLTGYGCTKPGGGGGNDGIYRIGEAKVMRIPTTNSNDINAQGKAALCFGDSGGPAFKLLPGGNRVLISINSRGDIRSKSYLSSVTTKEAKDFIASWLKSNQAARICGVSADAQNCRKITENGGGCNEKR